MIIVGGGIVGLSAALFLHHHLVPFILLERHASTSIYPRARGVNARTMEMFREVSIEDHVQEEGKARRQEGGIIGGRTLAEALEGFKKEDAKGKMAILFSMMRAATPCNGMISPLHLIIQHFTTTQHYAALRSTTQHHAAPRSTTQHHAAPRSTTQHHAAPRSTTQHYAALHQYL